jgi:hypothetical protein
LEEAVAGASQETYLLQVLELLRDTHWAGEVAEAA